MSWPDDMLDALEASEKRCATLSAENSELQELLDRQTKTIDAQSSLLVGVPAHIQELEIQVKELQDTRKSDAGNFIRLSARVVKLESWAGMHEAQIKGLNDKFNLMGELCFGEKKNERDHPSLLVKMDELLERTSRLDKLESILDKILEEIHGEQPSGTDP